MSLKYTISKRFSLSQWLHGLKFFIPAKPLYHSVKLKHMALIMDGNRRWAKKQNLLSAFGHKKGTETVHQLIEFCLEKKIEIVSIYAFSLENFNRSPEELSSIFSLIVNESKKTLEKLVRHGVQVNFIGDRKLFPGHVTTTINEVEDATKHLKTLKLNIFFCYGGQQEIVSAIQNIVTDTQNGTLKGEITQKIFESYLWSSSIPDPDLIIRTGGAKRLSNFLLYRAAYSELYFTDTLWPELTKKELEQALIDFAIRKRNYGI